MGNFFYVNFMISEFSYLNISSIGRNLIKDENDCGYACLEIPSCFSYNVAAFPDVNGKLLCELLPSDKFNNSDKFNASKEFHHFYIPSPCDSSPCKNTGKCIPLYQKNGYKCTCMKGFTGRNCETNINDCVNITCLNNGTCIDLIDGFNCSCPPGFAGSRCEIDCSFEQPGSVGDNFASCLCFVQDFTCAFASIYFFARHETHSGINGTNRYFLFHPDVISNVVTQFLSPAIGNDSDWALCWQASTHGWAASTFHSRCDGKNHTITIIKKDEYVFGGYTDIPWAHGYSTSSKSFVFSLLDKEGLAPFKSMVTNTSFPIYRDPSYGPTFGGGHDIYIADNANQNANSYANFGTSYSLPNGITDSSTILAGTRYFSPDEVEVFYLA
ncbi:unnamed protein product [Porites lobata]|uniref:Uncharacterized protein n=1 Tax=Porites lobata TaxID=104759 RepID=A0ABN8NSE7_9CNID|nr:unnamed protein product [Porites lobata]